MKGHWLHHCLAAKDEGCGVPYMSGSMKAAYQKKDFLHKVPTLICRKKAFVHLVVDF